MNKNLRFFGWLCLLTMNFHYVSKAQATDTVVTTAKPAPTIQRTYSSTTKVLHPTVSEYPEYNFSKIVDGRIPGLQTTNGGGQPGSSAEMLIRGMSSLSDNNAPLIILDGIPYYGDLSSINVNDIYYIKLFKDAMNTFQFGNRSGNGILYIKTKEKINDINQEHTPSLEVNAKFGISTQAIADYNTLGAKDYYETLYTAMRNAGISGNVVDYLGGYNVYHLNGVGDTLQDEYLIDPTTGKLNSSAQLKYQDSWRKEMRRIGIRQSYDIASSARNDKGGYYFSAGYLNDKGYIRQTDFTKYSVRLNGDYKLLNWLKLGIKTQATTSNQDNPNQSLFKSSQLMAPIYPVYYRDGNDQKEKDPIITGMDKFDWGSLNYYAPNSSIGDRRNYPGSNDIALLYLDDHSNKTSMFLLNPYVEISFLKGFTYSANVGYNFNKSNGYDYYNDNHGAYVQMGGAEGKATNTFSTLSFIHRLAWDKEINKHHLTLTVGNEYFKQKIADSSAFHYLNNPSFATIASSKNLMDNKGYFSNLTYEYDEKYLLFAGFRKDATLMTESHWVNNWAVGAGYVISEERFMKNVRFINQLKLKASYGTQGRYFPTYSQVNSPFYTPPTMGYTKNVIPVPGNQLNIGMESGLFNGRLYFDINAYSRNSGENALSMNLWPASSNSQFKYNNKGIELSVYTTNILTKNFSWNTNFMLTHNKNTITSMPIGTDSILTANNLIYKKGNSMADFYMVEYAGVDPNNGDALYYAKDGNGNEIKTSDYWHAVETNRKNFGSAFPAVYGSMTNKFIYKNFELSIQVNYSLGGKYYDEVYLDLMNNGNNANNWSTDILNYWTPGNRITNVPRLDVNGLPDSDVSSRFLRSASYLNIANLYLGYSFNEAKIKKAKMKSLRVYLTASNLWMFAASKGMNPQGSFYGTPGYVYLPARSVMLGLNVGI